MLEQKFLPEHNKFVYCSDMKTSCYNDELFTLPPDCNLFFFFCCGSNTVVSKAHCFQFWQTSVPTLLKTGVSHCDETLDAVILDICVDLWVFYGTDFLKFREYFKQTPLFCFCFLEKMKKQK